MPSTAVVYCLAVFVVAVVPSEVVFDAAPGFSTVPVLPSSLPVL